MIPKRLPFADIAAAALSRSEQLVQQWCPEGRREGHEWKALNPTRSDGSIGSFSINLNTGAWGDFADHDAAGGDLISLYAYLFCNRDQGQAARELAEIVGIVLDDAPTQARSNPAPAAERTASTSLEKKKRTEWTPIFPVPDNASPPPKAHIKRGIPDQEWRYLDAQGRLLGLIWRHTTSDGGKEVSPMNYCRHDETGKFDWRGVALPEPRPLYGLDRLAAKPDAQVLIVEGEKCADLAHKLLTDYAVVSWSGGGKAVAKADWTPIKGRTIVCWPDCDAQRDKKTQEILPELEQPGTRSMRQVIEIAHGLGCESTYILEIPIPGTKVSGWDIADAVDEGMIGEALNAFVRDRRILVAPSSPPADDVPPVGDSKPASTASKASAKEKGNSKGREKPFVPDLVWTKNGLASCMPNVFQILKHEPGWKGVVAFDEFAQRVIKQTVPPYGGEIGEWDSIDDSRTSIWLAGRWEFAPTSDKVAEAVEVLGRENCIHPVRAWLRSLPKWDGIPRRFDWLSDCLGVEESPYVRRVSYYFLMGMIARVMFPGVKFDYCLVLEGAQGKGKSTALRILGGEWYGDTDLDLQNKDAMSALRGRWLHEFSEMGSVTKAESTKQKSFLSRMVDEYRPVYGRREIKSPRQVVFAGTTNEWEWNKDPTGGRRFWPVMCSGEIKLDELGARREQLFAEVYQLFMEGLEKYPHPEKFKDEYCFWPHGDEQERLFDPEQLKVQVNESLIDALHPWVDEQLEEFTMADAVMKGLHLDASKLQPAFTGRVGTALAKLGCMKVERRNHKIRFWYKPPGREERWASSGKSGSSGDGGPDVGF